jgi:hypothetical protein
MTTDDTRPPVPSTPTGRQLFTDMEPMDLWESDGVLPEDIIAIETEAAAAERARHAALVAAVDEAIPVLESIAMRDDPMAANMAEDAAVALRAALDREEQG